MASKITGKSILLVEDEPLIALDMADALESAGYDVTIAFNQHDALDLIEKHDWYIAIVDYDLGDGDCLPISDWLVEHGVPFVLVSGYKQVTGSARAGNYLPKPATQSSVITMVEHVGSVRQSRHDTARPGLSSRLQH